MLKHLNILVTGQVQGVGYRFFAQRAALRSGIYGFVRNLPDGNVYIEAEGGDEPLQAFLEMCREGPRWAEVAGLEVEEGEVIGYQWFELRPF